MIDLEGFGPSRHMIDPVLDTHDRSSVRWIYAHDRSSGRWIYAGSS